MKLERYVVALSSWGFGGCSGCFNGGGVRWCLGSELAQVVKADGDQARQTMKVKIVYVVWLVVWKERYGGC